MTNQPTAKTHRQPFTLRYGVEHDGKLHLDGTLRVPTLLDREEAIEEVPESSSEARVNRHVWARTIERLGDIPKAKITPDLLAGLVDDDYGAILRAEEEARKKLLPMSADPEE